MQEQLRRTLIDKMTDNLIVLRAKLGITQAELADIIGTSRQTILALEKKQRIMTWTTFLSLMLVFSLNEDSGSLLGILGISTDELKKCLTN